MLVKSATLYARGRSRCCLLRPTCLFFGCGHGIHYMMTANNALCGQQRRLMDNKDTSLHIIIRGAAIQYNVNIHAQNPIDTAGLVLSVLSINQSISNF